MPKSNGKEKAAKWTHMPAKQSLQHSPDLDPPAPITSNIPSREASREPLHWVKCEGYALRMRQDRRRLAQTCTKFDSPLEPGFRKQQTTTNKTVKTTCLTLVGLNFFMFYGALRTLLLRRPRAKVKRKRKNSQVYQHARGLNKKSNLGETCQYGKGYVPPRTSCRCDLPMIQQV